MVILQLLPITESPTIILTIILMVVFNVNFLHFVCCHLNKKENSESIIEELIFNKTERISRLKSIV